jgi:ATP-dependent DNA helicase RecG
VRILDGHELLVFEVESASRAVMVDGNGFPYRIGDSTRQFSEQRINAIKELGIVESIEARRSRVSLAALDDSLIVSARKAAGLAELSVDEYLVRRRLADRGPAGLVLREAAVFLFARTAEAIEHPSAGVRVFRVAGTERLTGERHNVQEFPRIEGNLPGVIRDVRTLLDTLIQKSARLHDLFFREMPDYPTFVWTEAVVNAVAHRDYSVQGRWIEIWLFDDRLEVKSPGVAPATVSMDDLKQGRPAHATRNPRLVRVLVELGLMREQGEGIPRMFEEMQVSFLPMPELDSDGGWFHVVLRNTPIFQTTDPRWSQAVRELAIPVSEKRALVAMSARDFANEDYRDLNRVDRDTAYRELQDLIDRGLIQASGAGAGTRYRVIKGALAPTTAPPTPTELLVRRMESTGFITNADYREAFGVDRYQAKQALARWTATNVLVREGERRAARYRAGPSWPPV